MSDLSTRELGCMIAQLLMAAVALACTCVPALSPDCRGITKWQAVRLADAVGQGRHFNTRGIPVYADGPMHASDLPEWKDYEKEFVQSRCYWHVSFFPEIQEGGGLEVGVDAHSGEILFSSIGK